MRKHGKMGRFGQVNRITGQKMVILSGLKRGLDQSGCGLDRVDPYFSHEFYFYFYFIFIFFKKTTYICHLESHATNYLM